MAEIPFGQFLLNNGTIGEQQLEEALEYQNEIDLFLAEFVIKQGLLTPEQVNEVYSYIGTQGGVFTEAAVNLGYLNGIQAKMVDDEQQRRHRFLGEILVMRRILPESQVDKLLLAFEKEKTQNFK